MCTGTPGERSEALASLSLSGPEPGLSRHVRTLSLRICRAGGAQSSSASAAASASSAACFCALTRSQSAARAAAQAPSLASASAA